MLSSAIAWKNFSAYPSETDFGSTANSDNEILLMPEYDSVSGVRQCFCFHCTCSSSANNGKFFVPNLLNISTGTTVTWTKGELHCINRLKWSNCTQSLLEVLKVEILG